MRSRRALAAALACAMAFAAEASAQGWSHDGVSFAARENWCARTTQQDDGQGNQIPALELRPCGQDYPYLSLGVGARAVGKVDLASLTAQAAAEALGPSGEATTTAIFRKQDPGCTQLSRTIARDTIEGLSSLDLLARYSCPALSSEPTLMRNLTAYAQRKNGDVWIIAFDHPYGEITDADKAMIRLTIATIELN